MTDLTKIATCHYCGSRTILSLRRGHRTELSCRTCAAPLHEMKSLKVKKANPAPRKIVPLARAGTAKNSFRTRPKPKKDRSSLRYLVSEAFDEEEDFFDDLVDDIKDIFD